MVCHKKVEGTGVPRQAGRSCQSVRASVSSATYMHTLVSCTQSPRAPTLPLMRITTSSLPSLLTITATIYTRLNIIINYFIRNVRVIIY